MPESDPTPTRTELLDLYRVAMQEYQFQVNLNWDRTKYYMTIGCAVLTAGTALFGSARGDDAMTCALVAVLFLGGAAMNTAAIRAVRRGEKYYRMIVLRKTRIEHLLGLDTPIEKPGIQPIVLAAATTAGMLDARAYLERPVETVRGGERKGVIRNELTRIFLVLVAFDLLGTLFASLPLWSTLYSAILVF